MFTILIPSWNNLEYLKLCIRSILSNSRYAHQVIVHVNEGTDNTREWLDANLIEYTYSDRNIGVCKALNTASAKARLPYIVFMNDDMFVLPGWDRILIEEIESAPSDSFMISATMIEPRETGNQCVIVADYGSSPANFKQTKLLGDFNDLRKEDWNGSTWPPNVVSKRMWDIVGGYSEEFSPGMSSDDDFAMKMWQSGCRYFKGSSQSRVYHFISKSTGRVRKNDGKAQFLLKWGMKQSTFHKFYTRRGTRFNGTLANPKKSVGFLISNFVDKAVLVIIRLKKMTIL